MKNGTMMQYFQWYLPSDGTLWNKVSKEAENLKNIGITALWLPPAYKGNGGIYDVGYAVYDLYDLGEFYQKNTIRTKYGTKEEYINAIKSLKKNGIQAYADISLDHKIGADETEMVLATEDDGNDRNRAISQRELIEAWTKFTFPGRNNKYSDFKWNWTHFDGVDWDEKTKKSSIYKFESKEWNSGVDSEYGNYDYLMGADIDFSNKEVVEELLKWGRWYLKTTDVDGFRLDAAKHISYSFLVEWVKTLRKESGKELFTVAEYWNADIDTLVSYIGVTGETFSLIDVPLHFHFNEASKLGSSYDMRNILKGTLMERKPIKAVTFVDNHDTQKGQALESWVESWFKPLAYSIILLRAEGYPCVFYGDYYGIEKDDIEPMKPLLDKLIKVRAEYAYGNQNDYFDDKNIIGWTREGNNENNNKALAVLMSNGNSGSKKMYVGQKFANRKFYDITSNIEEEVIIDNDGKGLFKVNNNNISVWIER